MRVVTTILLAAVPPYVFTYLDTLVVCAEAKQV